MKDKKDPIVPNPAESPQFSPRLVSTWTTWLLNLIKNITIEPALFLISFSTQMDDVSLQQMTIYKTCMLDFEDQPFGGNETICSQLELEEYREENGIVQEEVCIPLYLLFCGFKLSTYCIHVCSSITSKFIKLWSAQCSLYFSHFTWELGVIYLVGNYSSIAT